MLGGSSSFRVRLFSLGWFFGDFFVVCFFVLFCFLPRDSGKQSVGTFKYLGKEQLPSVNL